MHRVIDDFTKSKDVDLQQRCLEFQHLITTAPHILGEVLPVDASCEDVQVDPNLSFLDMYVNQAIADGAKEYEKPEDDDDDDDDYQLTSKKASAFKMTPYEKPAKPGTSFSTGSMVGVGSGTMTSSSISGVTPPPGAYGANTSSTGASVNMSSTNNSSEPQLNVRNVANVWGKGGLNTGGGVTMPPPAATPPAAPAPAPSTNTWSTSTSYSSSSRTTQPPPEPVKSEEQLRKEKMAAALFGGSVPVSGPSTSVRVARRTTPRSTAPAAASNIQAPVPAAPAPAPPVPDPTPAPVPAPAPAPEVDLLDFMSEPSPAVASSVDTGIDILSPTPVVEPEPEPEPTPAVPAVEEDPFAASGLLDGFTDAPLNALVSEIKFQHNGLSLAPLQITTPQFGGKWGSTPHSSPLSTTSTKYSTLDGFMGLCKSIGAHNIESIPATNEGICAGMLGGADIVLIHGKVSNGGRIDVTIKSTDASIGGCLAMYMQNMLK